MAAAGGTLLQLYYSTINGNTPLAADLAYGELAVNAYNGKLYYKNSNTGAVAVLADGAISTGNLPGGSAGSVVYQSATGVTAYLPIGAANSLLYSTGSLPAYATLGAAGAIVYTNGTAPTSLAIGAQGSILYANGTVPAYASIGTAGSIIYSNGTAPTSVALGATGSLLYSNGTTPAYLPVGSNTFVLVSNGTNPTYVNPASLTVGVAATAGFATSAGSASTATTATTATNIAGGGANEVVYQSGSGTTTFVSAPITVGTVLGWNGTNLTWVNAPAATTTTNISGGAQYQIPFQSGVGNTTFNSNLTFNSSTNTFGTTNVSATGSVSAGTLVSATTSVSAGTTVTAGTSITATTSVTGATLTANGAITGSSATGAINYGTLSYSDANTFASYQTSVNAYAQQVIQNTSTGSSASVDFIVSNDQGTASTYYGDFGMNSSTYVGTGPFQAANIVYMYSISTDLVIGTKSSHYLRLVTNDNAADSVTVSPTNAVAFNGSYGVAGQVLKTNGTASAPTWVDVGTIVQSVPSFLLINAGVS
jgi:hypothetical protein